MRSTHEAERRRVCGIERPPLTAAVSAARVSPEAG
jgi:hypothetical protein